MSILIKACTIIDPRSKHHKKKADILIEKGTITKIASRINPGKSKVISSSNLHVSPGWVDIGTQSGEPGLEQRDTIQSTLDTAASGGFTRIALFSNTARPLDNASMISFIKDKSKDHAVHCHSIGALSKGLEGKELAEMIDMKNSGAIGFGDASKTIMVAGLLKRALQYSQSVDSVILHHPQDSTLGPDSQIHEGVVSTSLGLTGNPSIAETVMINRDMSLLQYTGGKLMVHLVSSAESVEQIKKFKKTKNINLFASVAIQNLKATDEDLLEFDVNHKVKPPLRAKSDQQALIKALHNDAIDIICTNHTPLEQEEKLKEFVYAKPGALNLQTCGLEAMEILEAEKLVEKLSLNARRIFALPEAIIGVDSEAELTLWDPSKEYIFSESSNKSFSKNSPNFGKEFSGSILGIISKGNGVFFNQ